MTKKITVEVNTPIGSITHTVTGSDDAARRKADQIADEHRALGVPVTIRES